jgi:predicted RNase H-like HicB family nuclease
MKSIREPIRTHIEDRMGDNEGVPQTEPVSYSRLEVVL